MSLIAILVLLMALILNASIFGCRHIKSGVFFHSSMIILWMLSIIQEEVPA